MPKNNRSGVAAVRPNAQKEPGVAVCHSSGPEPGRFSRQTAALAAILLLLVFAVFSPVLRNGFVNYDDPAYVTENFHVQSTLTWQSVEWAFRSEATANWFPLTWLSHMADFQMFGLRAWGHHLTNLLLHAANSALLFLVLWLVTGARWRSWIVAALFGLHPQHVESVAWVAERKDVLCAFFWLLALLGYVRYARAQAVKGKAAYRSARRRFYFLSLFFFACALMSKPMAVTFPCVLLLLDYWPLERFVGTAAWRVVAEKLPFFVLAGISSVVTMSVQSAGGAMAGEELPLPARAANAAVSYASYLGKIFFPSRLAVFYPYPAQWPALTIIRSVLVLVAISVGAVMMRRGAPYLLVGWLWFLGMLVPVIGLVQVGSQAMADRYSYLPSVGVFMAIAWGASAAVRHWKPGRMALGCAAVVAVAVCTCLTWRQIGYWRNGGTLFGHALAVTNNNLIAYSNLANYEVTEGREKEAIQLCREALKIDPNFAPIQEELGVALSKSGRLQDGVAEIEASVTEDPDSAQAHSDLAEAFVREGKGNEAINEYEKAIRLFPNYLAAYDSLGMLFESAGRFDEAIQLFHRATELFPAYADAHDSLGLAFAYKGRVDDAVAEYELALRLKPASARTRFALAILLEGKGQIDGAIQQLKAGLKLEPKSAEAHNELGSVLAREGKLDDAIGEFQEAVRLKPDYAKAKNNLELALKMRRK